MKCLRVLVIDDSPTIRAMIEQIVSSSQGCRVVGSACDVPTARHMLGDLMPNVVTLDLAMPGVNGIEFLAELIGVRHAPVVVLSSSTTAGSVEAKAALALGATAVFDKAKLVSEAVRFLAVLRRAADPKPDQQLPNEDAGEMTRNEDLSTIPTRVEASTGITRFPTGTLQGSAITRLISSR